MEQRALRVGTLAVILKQRAKKEGLTATGLERISRPWSAGRFQHKACKAEARDVQIMEHTQHKDLQTMRCYVWRVKLTSENPAKLIGL